MRDDKLSIQSMDFAVSIINLVKELKFKKENIISNQIGRSGTSIGANIREAQYAHGKADFVSKLQIALKEANETGYWLELLYKTNHIDEETYKNLDSACTSIRVMLISLVNTVKSKSEKQHLIPNLVSGAILLQIQLYPLLHNRAHSKERQEFLCLLLRLFSFYAKYLQKSLA